MAFCAVGLGPSLVKIPVRIHFTVGRARLALESDVFRLPSACLEPVTAAVRTYLFVHTFSLVSC